MKFNTKPTEEKMQKTVSNYESNLSTIRASQANTAIVSKVTFEYYGAPTKLVDMASVSVTDPKTLTRRAPTAAAACATWVRPRTARTCTA